MPNPAISIVVPVFNAERHLAECINSLLGQDCRDFEIIAVDDGSQDESNAILTRIGARDSRLRVVVQNNLGPSVARNVGLSHATGDYVWFVDSDDVVVEGALSLILNAARIECADIVTFNATYLGDHDGHATICTKPKPSTVVTGEEWIRYVLRQKEFLHFPWLSFYRRDFLSKHEMNFLQNVVHEDIGWTTECLLHAVRVIYVDKVVYSYRRHSTSITGERNDAAIMRRIDSYFSIVEQLRTINDRCPMLAATRLCLRSEIVGQGLQVDRLCRRLADRAMKKRVRAGCRSRRFWEYLFADAVDFKGRRRVLKALIRQRLWLS